MTTHSRFARTVKRCSLFSTVILAVMIGGGCGGGVPSQITADSEAEAKAQDIQNKGKEAHTKKRLPETSVVKKGRSRE